MCVVYICEGAGVWCVYVRGQVLSNGACVWCIYVRGQVLSNGVYM